MRLPKYGLVATIFLRVSVFLLDFCASNKQDSRVHSGERLVDPEAGVLWCPLDRRLRAKVFRAEPSRRVGFDAGMRVGVVGKGTSAGAGVGVQISRGLVGVGGVGADSGVNLRILLSSASTAARADATFPVVGEMGSGVASRTGSTKVECMASWPGSSHQFL